MEWGQRAKLGYLTHTNIHAFNMHIDIRYIFKGFYI